MTDLALDSDYDILIENGDIAVEDGDAIDMQLILNSNKGTWKNDPLVGVGLINYINATMGVVEKQKLKREINIQASYDGFTVESIDLSEGIQIEVKRINQ